MYGIVNVAIQDYALENYGPEKWEIIKMNSGIDIDFSLTDNAFNDSAIYDLAKTASSEMNHSFDDVLEDFGQNIIQTAHIKFNSFIESRGNTLKDYLINLPNFHNRIAMIYPELTPPQFKISHIENDFLYVHYISKTKGLKPFVAGYLKGLVNVFNEPAAVTFLESKEDGRQQEIFKISW